MPNAAQQQKKDQAKEAERKRETSKAAQKSIEAQKEAKRLTQAAAAAGDPDERQKLLNEALEKEVEAENFGKTAKYLQTGAFQGLCAGAGLGGGIGVSLGVLTGSLVGGTTSLVTGGLGAGLGLGVGAAHGPWFKVGEWMGEGIRKITGDIPGWKATEEQKGALEDMVNGVREQDRPDDDELLKMTEDSAPIQAGKGFTGQRKEDEKQKGLLQGAKPPPMPAPPLPGFGSKQSSKRNQSESKVQGHGAQMKQPAKQSSDTSNKLAGKAVTSTQPQARQQKPNASAPQSVRGTSTNAQPGPTKVDTRQVTRKPSRPQGQTPVGERKHKAPSQVVQQPTEARKPPRKLEVRSTRAG